MAHKYNAKRCEADGFKFASMKEARRYGELKLLLKAGWITDLELQPRFYLGTADDPVLMRSNGFPKGRRACYVADFKYYDTALKREIVEDVKGFDTATSRLKRALVEWQYKIRVEIL